MRRKGRFTSSPSPDGVPRSSPGVRRTPRRARIGRRLYPVLPSVVETPRRLVAPATGVREASVPREQPRLSFGSGRTFSGPARTHQAPGSANIEGGSMGRHVWRLPLWRIVQDLARLSGIGRASSPPVRWTSEPGKTVLRPERLYATALGRICRLTGQISAVSVIRHLGTRSRRTVADLNEAARSGRRFAYEAVFDNRE